jgi:hypothetical protein
VEIPAVGNGAGVDHVVAHQGVVQIAPNTHIGSQGRIRELRLQGVDEAQVLGIQRVGGWHLQAREHEAPKQGHQAEDGRRKDKVQKRGCHEAEAVPEGEEGAQRAQGLLALSPVGAAAAQGQLVGRHRFFRLLCHDCHLALPCSWL